MKMRICSSVATLDAYKSESRMKTSCYVYKNNTIEVFFGVISGRAHGRHHPTY